MSSGIDSLLIDDQKFHRKMLMIHHYLLRQGMATRNNEEMKGNLIQL